MSDYDSSFVTTPPSWERKNEIVAYNEGYGGRRSYEACTSDQIPYKMPTGRTVSSFTTACNEEAKLFVPYSDPTGETNHVLVCMNDDAVHLWPRFGDAAKGRPEELA